jgi:hypothetical protein
MDGSKLQSLVEVHGRQEARKMAQGRRGARAVDAAADWMELEEHRTSFIYSGWCQTALPHRRRPDDEVWRVVADRLSLLVEPGAGADGRRVGVPFGPTARLILIYLQSEALRCRSREVALGGSLRAFLRRVGVPYGGRGAAVVRDQAARIGRCRMSFHWSEVRNGSTPGRALFAQTNIVDFGMLVPSEDDRQGALFLDKAVLSEPFWRALEKHAVPLDEGAVATIHTSSMALDAYCWLAYRLHHLEVPTPVSWVALRAQFGAGFARLPTFRDTFREAMALACSVYPAAQVDETPQGLLLKPSRPPVARRA